MLERLIEFSIRNRFLVLAIAAALSVAGVFAALNTPVDAVPDLSENQVIVFTDWMGRSPREIEDQVTYPLSRQLQGLAGVKAVRSSSEFNFSMITIIFNDNIDFYFARQRVTEKLGQAGTFLPAGIVPYLAPDATAVGQIYWYTVESDAAHPIEPGKLWALNKFYIVPELKSVEGGVADVAVVGGMPLEYQIDVRPEDLRAYGITLGELYAAVGKSNMPSGGGVIQKNNAEYIVRGIGWIKDQHDIENTVIKEVKGTPIYVRNIATVQLGTQFRRSVFEKDGNEVTGGAVLMRHGENPLTVTERVKDKIRELQPGLPPGVHIVAAYDRTRLIEGAIHTLTDVMWHEMLIASIAVLLILMHVRSVFVICVTLPLAVLFSFLLMWVLRRLGIIDIQANIMSLAGITISIGILVDQAIVMTENATHHLKDHFGDRPVTGDIRELVIAPCRTVGRPIFFSVMIMLLSFVPVFMLSGREGKLFHPLAFTKSFAMIGVALLSVTLVPALIPTFLKGRLKGEEQNWIVRSFIKIYKPLLTWALPRRNLVMWLFSVLLMLAAGFFPLQALFGFGASESAWKVCFLIVFGFVTVVTALFTTGNRQHRFLKGFLLVVIAIILFSCGALFAWAGGRWEETLVRYDLPTLGAILKWLGFTASLVVVGTLIWLISRTQSAAMAKTFVVLSLVTLALWAYHFPKIGVSFFPPLDEGTVLDMPVTVPRASVTQVADDLKARDALLRGFPEVESVIGKAGRADTPTDPAPLDMVETFVNFRPKELWPKRVLRYDDAAAQTDRVLQSLEDHGYVVRVSNESGSVTTTDLSTGHSVVRTLREDFIINPTQKALERFDETMRELAALRYQEFDRDLGPILTRFIVAQTIDRFERAGDVRWPEGLSKDDAIERLTHDEAPTYGPWLVKDPTTVEGTRLIERTAEFMAAQDAFRTWYEVTDGVLAALQAEKTPQEVKRQLASIKGEHFATEEALIEKLTAATSDKDVLSKLQTQREKIVSLGSKKLSPAEALALHENAVEHGLTLAGELLSGKTKTFAGEVLKSAEAERVRLWKERVRDINWELFDQGVGAFTTYALEELVKAAGAVREGSLLRGADHERESERFASEAIQAQLGNKFDAKALEPILALRPDLEPPFAARVLFWPRQSDPRGDLVNDEMGRVLQVPGWSNIFTQPIMNRINMLATGVRTDVGIKVFGADLGTIDRVCKEIEAALTPVKGATYVLANPVQGKGYVQIDIHRDDAARYGISIEDIQNEIEVALGGRAVTFTVEERNRFPVRVRYARADRSEEESIRRLLISPGGAASASAMPSDQASSAPTVPTTASDQHAAAPAHSGKGRPLIPLSAVADVRIVEGPAMIKSENGRLVNYVTLNVRGRDLVGFVDEAQRVVADKVKLPEGVHIAWSGEFEHQARAARTLVLVLPAVLVLIFIILYLTYNDLADAALMMLAVPEALAGGALFLYLFPKITNGWDSPPVDFSVAVWVGFIACFGMAAETGIIMLVYLREAIEKRGGLANIKSLEELRQAVIEGAVHRLRPKLLTEGVAIIAIFPMVFAKGVGAEILAPMALPVLGGLLISDEVVDLFLPVRFYWVRRARWLKLHSAAGQSDDARQTTPAVLEAVVA